MARSDLGMYDRCDKESSWPLDLQLPMQSVPIITDVVRSNID